MEDKYKEMSDHELSSQILEIKVLEMGYKAWVRPTLPHNGGSTNAYCADTLENFDINNPADMWPIIVENSIEISPLYSGEWCVSCISEYTYEEYPIYSLWYSDKNPLRAAAIVFLMMKDKGE